MPRRDFILSIDTDQTLRVDPRDPTAIMQSLLDQIEEAVDALEICADPTSGMNTQQVARTSLEQINRMKQQA